MYSRLLQPPARQSFFLFGPRGTGKTAWIRATFPKAVFLDLLDDQSYLQVHARPGALRDLIPRGHSGWVVIDEVQRVPEILNEVHRLIEERKLRFVLTGSSARKLRRRGVNLLGGRALTYAMHPLTARELGRDFDLGRALRFGCLPFACTTDRPAKYLASYVTTYLREEVQQEGLTRNLAGFNRTSAEDAAMQEPKVNRSFGDVDPSLFVGRQLIQLCFSENTIDFAFDENISIRVEWGVALHNTSGQQHLEMAFHDGPGDRSCHLVGLLGLKVGTAVKDSSGSLELTFTDGRRLVCVTGDTPESYTVIRGEREWVE